MCQSPVPILMVAAFLGLSVLILVVAVFLDVALSVALILPEGLLLRMIAMCPILGILGRYPSGTMRGILSMVPHNSD